jgi:hypothetical protein
MWFFAFMHLTAAVISYTLRIAGVPNSAVEP